MSDSEYRIEDLDWKPGGLLIGPGGFECILGEPEDCSWYRDGLEVVERLNLQRKEIQRLKREVEVLIECRLGLQNCQSCPDGNCCFNNNPRIIGGNQHEYGI